MEILELPGVRVIDPSVDEDFITTGHARLREPVMDAAFNPDCSILAVATNQGVHLLDGCDEFLVLDCSIEEAGMPRSPICFSRCGQYLTFYNHATGQLKVFAATTFNCVVCHDFSQNGRITCTAFLPSDSTGQIPFLVFGTTHRQLYVADFNPFPPTITPINFDFPLAVSNIVIGSDGEFFCVSGGDFAIFRTESMELLFSLNLGLSFSSCTQFSPDSSRCVVSRRQGKLSSLRLEIEKPVLSEIHPKFGVTTFSLSPDGRFIIGGTCFGWIKFLSFETGEIVREFHAFETEVKFIKVWDDILTAVSHGGIVQSWKLPTNTHSKPQFLL